MSPDSREQTSQLMVMRRNLEKVRILCELIRKREKLKRDY
uniref:Uncharacterized protein n=1 Tax=Plectus sambesii TaxID=2011161 RepID=A0A914VJY3_9BILA